MTWTAGKLWAALDVLTHTDLNAYIGSAGNLFETVPAKATATGELPYAARAGSVAMLGIGTRGKVLTSTGSVPTWTAPVGCNVRDYGALGDGSTDDTGAFSAALTAGARALCSRVFT